MIPARFRENITLEVTIYGFPVQVNYSFYWPSRKDGPDGKDPPDPLVSHMEFLSDSLIISETGYRSHFFQTALLDNTSYQSVEELVISMGEYFAREEGYEPPAPLRQLTLF